MRQPGLYNAYGSKMLYVSEESFNLLEQVQNSPLDEHTLPLVAADRLEEDNSGKRFTCLRFVASFRETKKQAAYLARAIEAVSMRDWKEASRRRKVVRVRAAVFLAAGALRASYPIDVIGGSDAPHFAADYRTRYVPTELDYDPEADPPNLVDFRRIIVGAKWVLRVAVPRAKKSMQK